VQLQPALPCISLLQVLCFVATCSTSLTCCACLAASRAVPCQPLPDISGWLYGGVTEIGNAPVHIWQLFDRQGGKTSTYTFYTTPDGSPVRCVGIER
jgi:hypothetical protein